MKRLIVVIVLLILTPASVFADSIELKISGMVCAFCAQGIEKAFTERAEVKGVKVDLETKLVAITTKDDSDISDEQLHRIINDAGYNIVEIRRAKKDDGAEVER